MTRTARLIRFPFKVLEKNGSCWLHSNPSIIMANHHPASLTSVLAKCSHLHNGMFSLRQLGAIHRSLISSREKLDCSSIQNNPITSLEPILELQSPENQIVCQRILQDGNDMERLLVIQFLMAPLKCVDAMRCILLPYLLMRLVSEDFVIALLDLVEGVEEEHPQWSFVLETLQTTPSRPMATRILVCLFQKTIQPMPSLIQTFYETLWQTIADAISIPLHEFRNHPLIPCLSKEFLPVLCQTDGDGPLLWSDWHRPHTTHLWTRLMALAADNLSASSSTHQQQVLLVLTTVMCPLLPHLVGYELPDSETTEAARPFDQQILWQILYTCLSQGKSLWEEHSEASILRKRALYLLNTLATTQIWKKYVMCVEVLEMESEVHIGEFISSSF